MCISGRPGRFHLFPKAIEKRAQAWYGNRLSLLRLDRESAKIQGGDERLVGLNLHENSLELATEFADERGLADRQAFRGLENRWNRAPIQPDLPAPRFLFNAAATN